MKMLMTTAAALLLAGSAYAQTAAPEGSPATGSFPGNTGRVENGAPSNNPNDPGATSASGSASQTAMASDAMTVKNGKWMMGDRKATKSEIAEWKRSNPGMDKPL